MSYAENRLFGVRFGSKRFQLIFPLKLVQPGLGVVGSEAGATGAAAGAAEALPPKILNITVPQVGHLPLMALRPFFMVSSTASTISFLALHLTQYP
jgi:hypothetical protein